MSLWCNYQDLQLLHAVKINLPASTLSVAICKMEVTMYLLFTVWKNGTVFIKLWCFLSNLTKMQGREVKLFGNGLWQVITNHRNQSASWNFSE